MIDRVKLLIGLLSNDDEGDNGDVTVFEVAAMLYELGEEHQRASGAGSRDYVNAELRATRTQ